MSTPKPLSKVLGRQIIRLPLQSDGPEYRPQDIPSSDKLLSSLTRLQHACDAKDPSTFHSAACDYSTAMSYFRNQVPRIPGLDLENTVYLSALKGLEAQHQDSMVSFFNMDKEIWDERMDICVQSYKSMNDLFFWLVFIIDFLLKGRPIRIMPSSKVSAPLNQGSPSYVPTICAPIPTICGTRVVASYSTRVNPQVRSIKNNGVGLLKSITSSVGPLTPDSETASSSSMTLVGDPQPLRIDPSRLSFRNALGPPLPRSMALNRVSAFFFPVDPADPDSDVEMPLPINMDVDVTFDTDTGELNSATLRALICILSSHQGTMHPELTEMVFTCFRYFTTPTSFWLTLVKQYSIRRPDGLNEAQIRVWKNNDILRHTRVADLLRIWLEQYWSATHDSELQPRIREFFNDRIRHAHIDDKLKTTIHNAIYLVQDRTDDERFAEKLQRLADRAQLFKKCEEYPPTRFVFPFNRLRYLCTTTVLSSCYSEPGKDELARQLCLMMSANFRKVIPTDAIEVWLTQDKPKAQRKFVAAVSNLTLFGEMLSIMICFWIDVATLCHQYRNFNGAAYISCAIRNSVVSRMKSTVLAVPKTSKLKLHFLEKARGTEYLKTTNTKWLPILPVTAPLAKKLIVTPHTSNPTPIPNHIQFQRYWMFMSIISTLEKSQVPYTFTPDPQFQEWIHNQMSRFYHHDGNEGELIYQRFFEESKTIEPNEESLSSITVTETWDYMVSGRTFKPIKFPVEENKK